MDFLNDESGTTMMETVMSMTMIIIPIVLSLWTGQEILAAIYLDAVTAATMPF